MSFLTRLSLANRGLVALIAIVITGFGVYAVPSLKQQLLPSLEFPGAFIGASLPGASPEIIEEQVTKPIEDAVKGADGLDSIQSTTREGSATHPGDVRVRHRPRQRGQPAHHLGQPDPADSCRTASSRPSSPAAPTTSRRSCWPRPAAPTRTTWPNRLNDDRRAGARTRSRASATCRSPAPADQQVVITPDLAELAAAGVSPARDRRACCRPTACPMPAGAVDRRHPVAERAGRHPDHLGRRSCAASTSPAAPGPVRLGDVATVDEQPAPATSFTRTDGVDSLGIAVTAAPDGNAVQISHEVRDHARRPAATRPAPSSPSSSTRRRSSSARSRASPPRACSAC